MLGTNRLDFGEDHDSFVHGSRPDCFPAFFTITTDILKYPYISLSAT